MRISLSNLAPDAASAAAGSVPGCRCVSRRCQARASAARWLPGAFFRHALWPKRGTGRDRPPDQMGCGQQHSHRQALAKSVDHQRGADCGRAGQRQRRTRQESGVRLGPRPCQARVLLSRLAGTAVPGDHASQCKRQCRRTATSRTSSASACLAICQNRPILSGLPMRRGSQRVGRTLAASGRRSGRASRWRPCSRP